MNFGAYQYFLIMIGGFCAVWILGALAIDVVDNLKRKWRGLSMEVIICRILFRGKTQQCKKIFR
jgi:hypothetical protein